MIRRPCLFCCDYEFTSGHPVIPGKRYQAVTNEAGPTRYIVVDCVPCDGKGVVTMKGSFVDNR